ncbi:hypothetical protein [Caldibacillus thermoamylovorans]|uniref:hypothetical protein n=1 Tax=Caldibacillus thermoamylovorans TaxID=35841 RepID=UPI000A6EA1A8|nr:hypothetical protein [Caldibacillus thermoamylovorans]
MATSPVLVVILSRETPFFGDQTFSRRQFEARNTPFYRRIISPEMKIISKKK